MLGEFSQRMLVTKCNDCSTSHSIGAVRKRFFESRIVVAICKWVDTGDVIVSVMLDVQRVDTVS